MIVSTIFIESFLGSRLVNAIGRDISHGDLIKALFQAQAINREEKNHLFLLFFVAF